MTSEPRYPPSTFSFGVWLSSGTLFQPQTVVDAVFQEVSGIEPQVLSEDAVEGGVNRYAHRLPGVSRHSNLEFKRGYITRASAFSQWVEQAVCSTLDKPISTSVLNVSLLGPDVQPIATWSFQNAWPVRWEVGALDTMRNEILTETLEVAYTHFTHATPG